MSYDGALLTPDANHWIGCVWLSCDITSGIFYAWVLASLLEIISSLSKIAHHFGLICCILLLSFTCIQYVLS
jgi:hypothetical protein